MKKWFTSMLAVFFTVALLPVPAMHAAEETKVYERLELIDETYNSYSFTQVFRDENNEWVLNSIQIPTEINSIIEASNDQVTEAKKQLLAFYMKFDLTNKMNELLYESIDKPELKVNTMEPYEFYVDTLKENEAIAVAYAQEQKAEFEKLSEAEQEAQRGYSFYYSDYGQEYISSTHEYVKRLHVQVKEVTDSTITVSWYADNTNVPGGIMYMYLGHDASWGECFPDGTPSPCRVRLDAPQTFTFENLEPSKTYQLRIGAGLFTEDQTESKVFEATTLAKSPTNEEETVTDNQGAAEENTQEATEEAANNEQDSQEEQNDSVQTVSETQNTQSNTATTKDTVEEGKPLPKTATTMHNGLFVGGLVIFIGLAILVFQRKRHLV